MRLFKDIMTEAMEEMSAPDVFHAQINKIKGKFVKIKHECGLHDDLRILKYHLTREGFKVLS